MSTILKLDLSSSFSTSTAGSNWNEVKPTGNIAGVPNFLFSMVAVPSRHCFVVNGGLGYNNRTPLPYQTMAFNVSTSSWINIESGNQLQTRQAAMVIGNGDKIYLWGGNSPIPQKFSHIEAKWDALDIFLQVGTWTFIPYLNGTYNRIEHTATLSRDGRMIYYLGGLTATQYIDTNNTLQYALNGIDMSNIITFDTTNSSWGSVTTSSIAPPTQRRLHTAERIPGTNTLLLYGGAQMKSLWSQIAVPDGGAGPRYGHSIVFVDNSTLFIMFGIASDGATRSDFGVLNVTSWSWIHNFTGLGSSSTNSTDNPADPDGPDAGQNSKSNTGAIAGGVVGGVVGVALIAGVIFFFLRRKRQPPPPGSEGANVNMIDNHNDMGGQPGISSGFTDPAYYKSFGSERGASAQSPLFSTAGSAEDRTTLSSPTAVNKPDVYFGAPKLVMQPVKPDGA
ncbi:hypothetical protein BX666DRAFT_1877965 [Dichotomocladium elegans]|nr:hypothetical protein BX666DRAFT_1877965 [Dichotomocladium elegans]